MSLLNAHEHAKMHGELFNLDTLPEASLKEILTDPVQYLDKKLNGPVPAGVRAVGFKLFYDHLTRDYFRKMVNCNEAADNVLQRFSRLESFLEENTTHEELYAKCTDTWHYLGRDTELKVIHLRRKNKLETLVSLKTAFLTDEWVQVNTRQRAKMVLHLDFEECLQYFNKLETYEHQYPALFGGHQAIEVTYEALIEKTGEEMNRIFLFLGLPQRPVRTIMKKQIVHPLPEIIDNYAELKESFSATRWQAYFQ